MFFGPNTDAIVTAGLCTIAVLGAGGLLTEMSPWYANLHKPRWQPPGWVFAPAWTLIGVLAATAAVCAWQAAGNTSERVTVITLFAIIGMLNVGWSLLFFKLRRPDWALLEVAALWLAIVALIGGLTPLSFAAGALLAPYLAWVSFASVLNRKIVQMNQPFRRTAGLHNKPSELGS